MLTSNIEHGSTPGIIARFMPEFGDHSHHGGRNQNALESIWQTKEHILAYQWGKAVLKGIGFTVFFGMVALYFKPGHKRIFLDRAIGNQSLFLNRFKFHVAFGATVGTVYFGLNQMICPHGQQTLTRKLIVHGITGGLITATLWTPSSFFYGALLGGFNCMFQQTAHAPKYPRGFEARIQNFDKQKRQKVLRDDQQLKLSQQYIKAFGNQQLVEYN